jgi:hypothetical protein
VRASVLIGMNYVREQRWPLIVMVGVAFLLSLMAGLFGGHADARDTAFLVKETLAYGLVIGPMMAASAFYNDKRTRRILGVLSKGIERWEYLAGVMVGVGAIGVLFYGILAFPMMQLLSRARLPLSEYWVLAGALFFASLLAGAVALFYSTFMHPMLAMVATAVTASVPYALGRIAPVWNDAFPIVSLAQRALTSSLDGGSVLPAGTVAVALIEMLVFFAFACVVFARRDIAAAIE